MNNSPNLTQHDDAHRLEHERARKLIALGGPEALSASGNSSENAWLEAHLERCVSCRSFAENVRETIYGMRAFPIAAQRSLVSTTQMKVRRRALELRRQRERMWLVAVSCAAVTVCGSFSAAVLWRSFEWLGAQAQLASSVWQVGFLVFCIMPALVVGMLLLARGTQFNSHLADHNGSYQG
jgi:predicted anti-sigma-YlaC factor YlaD